jgi:hypothetical protein
MLWNASGINGYTIAASDDRLGTVSDFLFDDRSWRIRWLVVDTGTWLSGRKVLLPPDVLGHPDESRREFSVRLTRQQVEDSPDIDSDRPVSRQLETNVYDYYGWRPYWDSGLYMGGFGLMGGVAPVEPLLGPVPLGPVPLGATARPENYPPPPRDDGDPDLHSIEAVTGYYIHATDGEIGHVDDFLISDTDWEIRYLIVDTVNWWPGKKVLISPRSARDVDWSNKLLNLNVERQMVKDSPTYDPNKVVDRAYDRKFHGYYSGHPPNDRI